MSVTIAKEEAKSLLMVLVILVVFLVDGILVMNGKEILQE
jgi:hypothetical protein